MFGAVQVALEAGCPCAPVSGFHHAKYGSVAGYCTFNRLVNVSPWLRQGLIPVLDCDIGLLISGAPRMGAIA
jgi:acetoin utilization deacetylase AcuC-like enzyme